ncbi:MAG: dTMP kinase [Dehalococcoidales bacterium]|nr:dTMP kinase [Dehalococcoidales bacterium]
MFLTLEGPEGAGKSTQAEMLVKYLISTGRPAVLVREPGHTALGEALRDILLNRAAIPVDARAEVLLFAAARAELVQEVIRPELARGEIVVCDRYSDSTLAYQSFGRGLDLDEVGEVVRFATGGLGPDLTFLLDLPPEEGLRRGGKHPSDRFERETIDFHRRVREGYLTLARLSPRRWCIIDARLGRQEIAATIRGAVESLLKAQVS